MDLQSIERSSLFSYSIQYFWYKKRSVLLKILKNYFKSTGKENFDICDIGCEIGHDIFQIYDLFKSKYNFRFTGIDINDEAVQIAEERSRAREEKIFNFIAADIEKNFYLNEKFDIIIVSEIIEHLKNSDLFLSNLKKLLNRNGIIILSTPNLNNMTLKLFKIFKLNKLFMSKDYPQYQTKQGFDHISLFSKNDLMELIERTGLKIIAQKRVTFFYGSKFLDDNQFIFGLYLILDILFDKCPFLKSFSYNIFYIIGLKKN